MKIRNWKLAILALVFFCIFVYLGCWQISRAHKKQALLDSYAARSLEKPLNANALSLSTKMRFHQVQLTGTFDNAHSFLLDNKIYDDKIGYELYTPFKVNGFGESLLVDRGFIPMPVNRDILPAIKPILGEVTITGMLNLPPTYVAFGKMIEMPKLVWPLRVEYIEIKEISSIQQRHYYPYILSITPNDPAAYEMKWQIVAMGPERHMGYALQWFAFAATLLVLFVSLNRRPEPASGLNKNN